MATVELHLPHHRYAIEIAPGSLAQLGEHVRRVAPHRLAALIVDEALADTYGATAKQSLEAAGYVVVVATMPSTEEHKSLDTAAKLYGPLLDAKLERKSPVVALGGGIVGDTAGHVAATYLRGVPFVQCPTTLLAMVDASVGGKVGVNVPQGKNLVGAFHQPRLVLADVDTLRTLPGRELRCGLAECVKHAAIRAPIMVGWLEDRLDDVLALDAATLVELVQWNVSIKADVVMADEKETGERAHLNFGHTFAHALEAATGSIGSPQAGDLGTSSAAHGHYHHGEAVAIGMVAATRLAADAGRCESEVLDRLTALLDRIGLPTKLHAAIDVDRLLDLMRSDKKVAGGRIRLILPEALGKVVIVDDTPAAAITAAWRAIT